MAAVGQSKNGHGPLIVGYDGSEHAKDALALTRVLAEATGRQVEAISVVTYAPLELDWQAYERMLADDRRRLGAEVREALAGIEGVGSVVLPSLSPAREILKLAEARSASMIVLGATHRGVVGRVLVGTVADRLMGAAPCAIAIAPRGYVDEDRWLGRIAVAYDGSAESGLALEAAHGLARAIGARLELVAVADPRVGAMLPGAGGWPGTVITDESVERHRLEMERGMEEALAEIGEDVAASGAVVVDADPRSVIIEASERADLLVIGSRGYGPIGRVLLGGVSSAVLRSAACPVLVTPRSLVEADASTA